MRALAAARDVSARTRPRGVDVTNRPPEPPRERGPGTPLRLLHVGSLNPVKDQATLLAAVARLRDRGVSFGLDVVGFDTLDGQIQRLAATLGLTDSVHFHGFAPHAQLRPWFQRAHALVVISIHEAAPVVLLEAAIAGVPTVGTSVGHIADFVPDAAVAVPVRDPIALAAAIEALAEDEPRRLRLAAAAQMRAMAIDADFTAATMTRIYRAVGET
jgi:glycosyltransferase involved in cell wall biosynthesis